LIDNGSLDAAIPRPNAAFGDGVWHEIQTWQRRTGGIGYAKLWVDGKLITSDINAVMGSDNASAAYWVAIGMAYSNAHGPLTVYMDNAAIANGYIDP
jgi:hypothetical protein